MLGRSTLREIKGSLGRYLAILAIVALGVGFFSGLKVTKEAMVSTADDYLGEHELYDYRLVSTLGFEDDDVGALAKEDFAGQVQGSITADALYNMNDSEDRVMVFHSITPGINTLYLQEGRMPEADNECVGDVELFGPEDIGSTIVISDANEKDDKDQFKYKEYVITGLVVSPYYLNFERGSTALGNGSVAGFVYMNKDAFDLDYYTEIFVTLKEEYPIYSDEYKALIEDSEDAVQNAVDVRAQIRYESVIDEAREELDDGKKEYQENYDKYLSEKADAEAKLADSYREITDGQAQIAREKQNLADTESELKANRVQVENGLAQVEAQRQEFEAARPYMSEEQIAQTEAQLDGTENQLRTNLAQIDSGLSQIEDGRREIQKSERELATGLSEYYAAKADADREFADAEKELADARKDIAQAEKEIDDIKAPDTYVLDRETNIGYVCFESDSDIVDGIARVFPLFFFMVAALVCMTTMTRMVDEQRTQIGVFKALGYSNMAVAGKYLFYSGSASLIGCVSGFLAGCYVFPTVIWQAYGMMYDFTRAVNYVFNWKLAAISLAVSLLCSMGATLLSCFNEFREVPAQMIRPKSPKSGKRILMERVTVLWKRISFLYKVTFRNIFRYKKRFFMMLLGISGCTALLLTGFGIRDSIKNVVDFQYDEIQVYDYSVTFDKDMTDERQEYFETETAGHIDQLHFIHQEAADLIHGRSVKSITMIATEGEGFDKFVDLHTADGEKIEYPSLGEAVICRKLSDEFSIENGDTITFRDADMNEMDVKVTGICENFVYNYVYVSPETCEEQWGYTPDIKAAVVNVGSEDIDTVRESSAKVLSEDHVAAVTVNDDLRVRVAGMMKSLDYVIALIILSAGALAFIVLYNLTNINITERIREIATIKVLGFYPNETSAYVFRENFFLTGISAIVGLLLGKGLHAFVIDQIKIDMMYFDIRIVPLSYVFSVLLTFVFAAVVAFVMYYKLERISMTESLKSIE